MITIREARAEDHPTLWALNALPFKGATADATVPLPLPPTPSPPAGFPDLADVERSFTALGGAFLVAEVEGHLAGMGGIRLRPDGSAEVLRVRVHPATRRRGVGRALMTALETSAADRGAREAILDTTTEQPEAVAFYEALGYEEIGRETRPEWTWTLIWFRKRL